MRLSCFLGLSLGFVTVLLGGGSARANNDESSTFNETVWQSSPLVNQITKMAWAPDGSHRLFLARKDGTVAIIKDGVIQTSSPAVLAPWATVTPVYTNSECGLIGFTFDPDFVENHYAYLFVTVSDHEQQIQRWVDNPGTNTGTFDQLMIGGLATNGFNHDGGGMAFGPDGRLYWSIGDNGSGVGVNNDFQSFASKVGRINRDATLPLANPFYDAAGPHNDYLWARGFRNPFNMSFRPSTGEMWLNVTGNAWEQIFVVPEGSHGGWNALENNQTAGFLTPTIAYRTNSANVHALGTIARTSNVATATTTTAHGYHRGLFVTIAGNSEASFDAKVLITGTPTTTSFTFDSVGADASGTGGMATHASMGGAMGGGTFYNSTLFPSAYWGDFFFGDYNSGSFFRARPESNTVERVYEWANSLGAPLEAAVGPDGAMYVASFAYPPNAGAIYRTVPIAAADGPIVTPTDLWMLEGGNGVFDVMLPAAPASDTMVAVMRTDGDTDVSVIEGATLTFTMANWNVAQRVVVAAAVDADRTPDLATISFASGGLVTRTATVHVIDQPALGFYAYASPLTIDEGGSAMLNLGLTEAPTSDVTVTIAIGGDGDVTSPTTTLTFLVADGTMPKAITLSAAMDADATDDADTVTLTAPGYTTKIVNVTVKDNTIIPPDMTTVDLTTTATVDLTTTVAADLAGADLTAAEIVDAAAPADLSLPGFDDGVLVPDLLTPDLLTPDLLTPDLLVAHDLTMSAPNDLTAGKPTIAGGGCSCRTTDGPSSAFELVLALLGLALLHRHGARRSVRS